MSDDVKTTDWIVSTERALERIAAETGEGPADASRTLSQLGKIDPSLRPALLSWWQSGQVDLDREFSGWSMRRLIAAGWCRHVVHAFTWVDGLVRFPADTLQMLSEPRCEILVTGKKKAKTVQ